MKYETEFFYTENINTNEVKFHLFQDDNDKNQMKDRLLNLTCFYDSNYIGNKDFIEIPNLKTIIKNVALYPVMLATKKDIDNCEDILGVTTIKMENNRDINDNPYFPTKNENVLSITGVLAKLSLGNDDTRIYGIGKRLIKSAIRGAYNINKQEKTRLIYKLDCRNENSFKSISKAIKELQDEDFNINLFLAGYYEILSGGDLVEAPTFVLEVDLNNNKLIDNNVVKFSYLNCNGENLLKSLSQVIMKNTKELKRHINYSDNKTIIYHEICPINAFNIKCEVGDSANGNARIPEIPQLQLEYVQSEEVD